MTPADWSAVTRRVVAEAAAAHPHDVVLDIGAGRGELSRALAPSVRRVVAYDSDPQCSSLGNIEVVRGPIVRPDCAGVSVVVMNDTLSRLSPEEQTALLIHLGEQLADRALLVIGDVMWSLPKDTIDEPEQFGEHVQNARTTGAVEADLRKAGFLPDVHRFGVGRAVIISLRGPR
jgi:hypothetical protein